MIVSPKRILWATDFSELSLLAGRYARGLLCRVTGQLPDALRHWEHLIVEHVGHRDWFTPQLAQRLDRLHRAGVDVPDRLEQATAQGPLPDDEATSALWFRMIDPQQQATPASRGTEPKRVRMRPEDRSPGPSGPALHGPSR